VAARTYARSVSAGWRNRSRRNGEPAEATVRPRPAAVKKNSVGRAKPVRGIHAEIRGGTRKVAFTLNGARAEVGTMRVFFESKLVPLDGSSGFGFGGGWGGRR